MDDQEFKRRLAEVATWVIPKTERETSKTAKRRRGRPSKEEQYQELREEIFHEEFQGENPTIPLMLTEVKCQSIDCPDCGQHCASGRKIEAKLHIKNGKRIWREHCKECRMFKNPYTGKFELTGSAASIKFNEFMRGSKMKYNTKANEERRQYLIKNSESGTVVAEDDESRITKYHD